MHQEKVGLQQQSLHAIYMQHQPFTHMYSKDEQETGIYWVFKPNFYGYEQSTSKGQGNKSHE